MSTPVATAQQSTVQSSIPPGRLRLARILLIIATVSAVGAAVTQIQVVFDAGGPTKVVETWRLYGFLVFAGLFALLTVRPLGNLAVWLLVIMNKLALTVTGLAYQAHGGIADTGPIITWDGGLTVLLLAAFAVSRLGARPSAG
ncbi:hypothetical protein ONA91_33185 [Micromonospora sp. DR5-3]|uniref:hypothetical protein n=1 Tax=unclassified Micromonospora TaxID=2617518 RepID=UPI0011D93C60|nr:MULTISPECIES: hypothetical protein [unclassified Micromonospora]MCW3819308.1 hypothetical protein [Micromonospora sp. DR5-3]TYC10233.1 hypothetical protein FXF52_40735 [Micromonospora sp. MP36]